MGKDAAKQWQRKELAPSETPVVHLGYRDSLHIYAKNALILHEASPQKVRAK